MSAYFFFLFIIWKTKFILTKIYRYKVFNLILHSEDLEIPDLPETKSKIKPDVEVKKEDSSLWPRLQETKEDTYFIKIAKCFIFLL